MNPIPKARFEQFSDGVFAIAITLLALELHIPELKSPTIHGGLRELVQLIPNIATFVISFVTIAIFWVIHHQLTHELSHVTKRRVLWSNMLFLMFLTLIPFATQATSANPLHPLAMITYSLTLFGGSVSFSMVRYYVHRSTGERAIHMERSIVGPLLYLLAALSAFISVWGCYFLLAIPPLYYFLPKSQQK